MANQMSDYISKKDAMLATAASAKFHICELLRDLEVLALLIVGEEDVTTPVWPSEMLHEWLPNSEPTIVPEAGHLVIIYHHKEFNTNYSPFYHRIE